MNFDLKQPLYDARKQWEGLPIPFPNIELIRPTNTIVSACQALLNTYFVWKYYNGLKFRKEKDCIKRCLAILYAKHVISGDQVKAMYDYLKDGSKW